MPGRLDQDLPLREDIRYLGRILGDTIREQAGAKVFDLVERIRQSAIRYRRDQDARSLRALETTLRGLAQDDATNVVRAFSYFHQLANVAEDVHAERLGRADLAARAAPQPGSLTFALARVRAAHVPERRVRSFFEQARIEPVLTAHPTEVQRKSILDRQRAIRERLGARESAAAVGQEDALDVALRREVLTLWKTNELRAEKPTVEDEIGNGLAYFRGTFLEVVPRLVAEVEDELGGGVHLPPFLRVGSWIGGDRDGNPHVTHDVTARAIERQASVVLEHYLREIHALGSELSLAAQYVGDASDLDALVARSPDRAPSRRAEPFRRALTGIYARVAATARELAADVAPPRAAVGAAPPYGAAGDLLADLDVINNALVAAGCARLADGRLRRLRHAVEVFGFHLAALDIRQHSEVHARAVGEIVRRATGHDVYGPLDEAGRRELLLRELLTARPLVSRHLEYGAETAETLATLETVASLHALRPAGHPQRRHLDDGGPQRRARGRAVAQGGRPARPGPRAARGRQRHPALRDDRGSARMRRHHESDLLAALLPPPPREPGRPAGDHARLLGQQQGRRIPHVELGAVQGRAGPRRRVRAPRRAAAALSRPRRHRGRGGGPSYYAVRAQPRGSVGGQLRLTEQGEVIASKYADPVVGRRNLATLVAATIEATLLGGAGDAGAGADADEPQFRETLDTLSGLAFRAYRALVYETPGFIRYFREATPINEIGDLNIGSRPASRKSSDRIEDLRAIPWVFSWGQCRQSIPGFYGFGSAVRQHLEHDRGPRLGVLRTMYARWPFFRTLVDKLEMVLAKMDMGIAARYAGLVSDARLREAIFGRIVREHDDTLRAVFAITGTKTLLQSNPSLVRSLRNRTPYIDPLNHLQVDLLRRLRAGRGDTDELRRAIHLTINGVAAGLRNSG